ncbi:transglutaminase family protein [bacterium]|nr:MAG: transglutaminase family protein [bacterium]
MFYSIRHSTRFRFSEPVRQNIMEVMVQPRSEGNQTLRQFELDIEPVTRLFMRRDWMNNIVHHFDIPSEHKSLAVISDSLVEIAPAHPLPEALESNDWSLLDEMTRYEDHWDFLIESKFSRSTPLLQDFIKELGLKREADPLTWVRNLNHTIFNSFSYVPQSTQVDSTIDVALESRKGVCQDYTHIMIALMRHFGIPARYVSGYLFHRADSHDRSVVDATHAWIEVLLPNLGWLGFDPTNDLECGERHIRTAIGRDYSDVPPTKGVYIRRSGDMRSEIKVAVHVSPAEAPRPEELEPIGASWLVVPDSSLNWSDGPEEIGSMQQQ